jgi:hypothetical protein
MNWVWWVVIAAAVFSLLLLGVVASGTAARLDPMQRAQERLQQRLAAAQAALLPSITELQARVAEIQIRAQAAQAHLHARDEPAQTGWPG